MRRLLLFACLLLTACTAAGQVSSSQLRPTAEANQYLRDAEATQTARDLAVQQIAREMQATADVVTAQALAAATQSALASQLAATQSAVAALDATATVSARISADATSTSVAQYQATELAHVQATATRVYEVQATETMQVQLTRTSLQLRAEQDASDRARVVTVLGWVSAFVFIALGLFLIWHTARAVVKAFANRAQLVTYGPNHNPIIMAHNGHALTIIDPLSNGSPITNLDGAGNIVADQLSERAQVAVLLAKLQVLHKQAAHNPFPPVPDTRPRRERLAPELQAPVALPQLDTAQQLPPAEAQWQMLDSWTGAGLPLGVTARGLLTADPETAPHLLIAGTSGSGKTRYGLRPIIAAALAARWQVFIFDRSGVDFTPFSSTATLVILSEARQAVQYLALIYGELNHRLTQLRESGASTWGRGQLGPRLLCVFDEFSNLADSMPDSDRAELWRYARMVAAEGRKAGVHLALALQDPTHRSIDLRIRRNCTPMAFRVKDGEASRVVLGSGGAEALPNRQFLTVLDGLSRAVAFAPSDEQLAAFVAARAPGLMPAPAWLAAPATSVSTDTPAADDVARIRQMRAAGASLRAIEQAVYGYAGGQASARVKAALEPQE
jgi:hypothetical protein